MQVLKYIVEQIHTVVAATTDENGEPVSISYCITEWIYGIIIHYMYKMAWVTI